MHADGTLADGPLALVEVQGYVYMAKLRIADVYEALGSSDVATRLRQEAEALRSAFNEAFWDPQEGTFALALDGQKRQVRSVTSNPAHCLYCGIADPAKAAAVAERLMAPDMFCGWGIRTLSSTSPAFNPMSYHNGSVWPHDNAIATAGLKRYGFHDAAERIATALFDVAAGARDFRLPELYCGFDRDGSSSVVAYPVACIPQAWATAVPFMLLQAMLGISPRAAEPTLKINEPALQSWLGRLELHGLRQLCLGCLRDVRRTRRHREDLEDLSQRRGRIVLRTLDPELLGGPGKRVDRAGDPDETILLAVDRASPLRELLGLQTRQLRSLALNEAGCWRHSSREIPGIERALDEVELHLAVAQCVEDLSLLGWCLLRICRWPGTTEGDVIGCAADGNV
jgi:hypothetical protein